MVEFRETGFPALGRIEEVQQMASESGSLSGATDAATLAFPRKNEGKKEPAKNTLAWYCA